jgi:hypothetical protein
MACAMCEAIVKNHRGAPGHEKLVQIGEPEKVKIVGQANVYVTKYRCADCNTEWRHENDKNDDHAGWSMIE